MKKGYTLIELILSISIWLIIITIGVSGVLLYNNLNNKIKSKEVSYEINNLLTHSKLYCKKNKVSGNIIFDLEKEKVSFLVNSKEIKKVNIESGIDFIKVPSNKKILINSSGIITTATTIIYKDNQDNEYKITISVGNDMVNIYE